ncbi:pyruvate, phosphate dikinase [Plantactinospora sonchi]|uniref:Pyruvate, phosphate dikinase n=1 Tax=Plantactinospora sonchi TaxID=1544735 RepID=A0ABU7RZC0_9ACTN
MRWIHPLTAELDAPADVLGAKAAGLVLLRRLGLPVPPGFVIGTPAYRAFRQAGRLPDGLDAELGTAIADLERTTGRTFGGPGRPLVVSVRSGAGVSMPGMMSTVLNVGLTTGATAGLAAETGDPRLALDSRLGLLTSFAAATGLDPARPAALPETAGTAETGDERARLSRAVEAVAAAVADRGGPPVPDEATAQLEQAVVAVLRSWDTPRARTYRELHDIPHDLGTAVTVQAMVFGNRDQHSGTGVAFSRNPDTGDPVPFGEVLFGRQGEEVVSGRSLTRPLADLAGRQPEVWTGLRQAMDQVERHYRDACYLEFTFEAGELWLLQVRPARFVGAAAVRLAVNLADQGMIGRDEALRRISPGQLRHARTPRLATGDGADLLARGRGAGPGVAVGRVATTADRAVRMAATGPVILVRPETSPLDLHGLAAAAGVVTARGGPTSHAAVVARAMGKPAVVGIADLVVADDAIRVAGRTIPEGTVIAVDGTGGDVVLGSPRVTTGGADPHLRQLLDWADAVSGDASERPDAVRLDAAHAALARRREPPPERRAR